MDSADFKIIKRFGPSVLKVKIPENIIKTLNNHFDKVILNTDEERRCISFNCKVDDDLYNVYGG